MKLSTIWGVDRTIGVDESSPVALEVASRWHHDPGSVQFFRSSANFVYRLRRGGEMCFLRFTPESERRRADIEADVELLRWLDDAGLPVVQPICSRNGLYVESMASEWGVLHAVVFAALPGDQFDIDELSDERFEWWGASLGRLHAAVKHYPNAVSWQRRTWREAIDQAKRWIPAAAGAVHAEMAQLETALAALPGDGGGYGIIHGDFELDNLVWRDRTAQMLDFDDCKQMWFAADIAFALRDRFDNGAALSDPGVVAFLAGYAQEGELPHDAAPQIPLFSRLARMLQYAKIARALDLEPEPDHPAWLTSLVSKMRGRIIVYQTSLETP